jgi:hypothetical protein
MSEAWNPRRRAWTWVNFFLQIALLLAFLVVVNLLVRKAGRRYDVTSLRTFALTGVTEDALRRLDYDLEIWLTSHDFAMGGGSDKSLRSALEKTIILLEEFRKRSDRIRFIYVNPVDKGEIARLRRHFPDTVPDTLYFVATHGPERVTRKAVEVHQLYDGDPQTGVIREYRGEGVLLQSLRELAVSTKRVVYETFGHKEVISEDPRTMAILNQYLTGHEGIEFRRLDTAGNMRVPDDARLVLVLGPATPFQPHEVEILREYLERGGGLFVALRPRVVTGLEKFLEEYGVRANPAVIVHDPIDCVAPRMSHLRVRRFNAHEINRVVAGSSLLMNDACTVDPQEKGPGWKTVPLAQSGPESWAEKGSVGPDDRPRPDAEEPRGEQNLVVAVEKSLPAGPDGKPRKAKLVAWGSVNALTNQGMSPGGYTHPAQVYYVVNTFRWLMDRDAMEVGSRKIVVEPIQMSPAALDRMWWIIVVGFPLVGVALGLTAFFFRRK